MDEISMSHREHRVTYLTSDECRASTSTDSSARNESSSSSAAGGSDDEGQGTV